jgi:uncharacterized protein
VCCSLLPTAATLITSRAHSWYSTSRGPLVTTELVVAETAYLIGRQLGPDAEAGFFRSVANGDLMVEALTPTDYLRIAALVDRYRDRPLGGTDASLVAVAERLGQPRLATT